MSTFDESLPTLANLVVSRLGIDAIQRGVFLRDVLGRVTFVVETSFFEHTAMVEFREQAEVKLGAYVDDGYSGIATNEELGEDDITAESRPFQIAIAGEPAVIALVDRRIVGQDWLAKPAPGWRAPDPARIVFWSLKGGVGRTTALTIAATHLSSMGKRVLTIDLDLEAPGLGSILLTSAELPRWGMLDWFIENNFRNFTGQDFDQFTSPSLFSRSPGLVHVAPAIGRIADNSPENVVAKLGRAYLEDIAPQKAPTTFLQQTRAIVQALESAGQYDATLIDARAGLNESTPAAILGLGADVLLFGENTPQTFNGYRFLLAHLRGLKAEPDDDWRLRFKMVHAKASPNSSKRFNNDAYKLFAEYLYETESDSQDSFNFDLDDPDAPHVPWVIGNDANYHNFNPSIVGDQLNESYYKATFGQFIDDLKRRIEGGTVD